MIIDNETIIAAHYLLRDIYFIIIQMFRFRLYLGTFVVIVFVTSFVVNWMNKYLTGWKKHFYIFIGIDFFCFSAKFFNGLYTINTLHLWYLSKLEFGNRNINKKSGDILRTMKCFIFCKNAIFVKNQCSYWYKCLININVSIFALILLAHVAYLVCLNLHDKFT